MNRNSCYTPHEILRRIMWSMSAQDQSVVHTPRLVVVEGRQVGHGGGFGFVEDGFGHGLERSPAGPFEVRSVGDLAQEAAPFDDDAVDVAGPQQVTDPTSFV